jgi:hypothetical protein
MLDKGNRKTIVLKLLKYSANRETRKAYRNSINFLDNHLFEDSGDGKIILKWISGEKTDDITA